MFLERFKKCFKSYSPLIALALNPNIFKMFFKLSNRWLHARLRKYCCCFSNNIMICFYCHIFTWWNYIIIILIFSSSFENELLFSSPFGRLFFITIICIACKLFWVSDLKLDPTWENINIILSYCYFSITTYHFIKELFSDSMGT